VVPIVINRMDLNKSFDMTTRKPSYRW